MDGVAYILVFVVLASYHQHNDIVVWSARQKGSDITERYLFYMSRVYVYTVDTYVRVCMNVSYR